MYIPVEISKQTFIFVIAFFVALLIGPILIPMLTRLKFGQTVRDDGPTSHFKKTGTPTMGGVIFLIPVFLFCVYSYYSGLFQEAIPLSLVTLGFGLIGLMDDFLKIKKKSKDGLSAGQKMLGLFVVAALFASYMMIKADLGTDILIPLYNRIFSIDLAWGFIPFSIFILLATTNAMNITDGLDGLAAGITFIIMIFFTVIAATRGEWDDIRVFSSILAGGCLGFLFFNIHPAKVFMGDTGSLALGGAIAAIAISMKMPLIILLICIIPIIETLSVIIQVGSFKLTGKRVFKMAPIHHHFELKGWKETVVVTVFCTVTFLFCLLALLTLW